MNSELEALAAVRHVLEVARAVYGNRGPDPSDDLVIEAWADAVAFAASTAELDAAMADYISDREHPPTPADIAHLILDNRQRVEREHRPPPGPDDDPYTREEKLQNVRNVIEAMHRAKDGNPMSQAEFLAGMARPSHEQMTHCPECTDAQGWVEVDPENPRSAVRPCSVCSPDQHALWRDHWSIRGHSCDDCRPRRGRRGATR